MSGEITTCWYFAFGSNMNTDVFINTRKMAPLSKDIAKLSGYALLFDQKGIPLIEPAFASIKECDHEEVWGVLYQLTKKDFNRLHLTEGSNYEVRAIEVEGNNNGKIQCYAYVGRSSRFGLSPSRRYLGKLIVGAIEHELPEPYINKLKSHRSTYLPVVSELAGWALKFGIAYAATRTKKPLRGLGAK